MKRSFWEERGYTLRFKRGVGIKTGNIEEIGNREKNEREDPSVMKKEKKSMECGNPSIQVRLHS